MSTDAWAPPVDQASDQQLVSRALWRTHNAVEQALDAVFAPVGLSTTLQGTLRMIAARPGASAADLARTADVRPQSMAQAVTRLESLDLVTRSPHPVHGRIQQVAITDAGRAALDRADALLEQAEHDLTVDLTPTDRDRLLTDLEAIRARVQDLQLRQTRQRPGPGL